MLLTSTHLATLVVVFLSTLCWGLWANTFKMSGKWRFEMYYVDFAAGAFAIAVVAALTVGTLGFDGFSFTDDLLHASKRQDLMAFIAGVIFNLGNMLLLGAVSVAGMTIGFSLAFGVALCLGALWGFVFQPSGSSVILFAGAAVVLVAVVAGAYAYRSYQLSRVDELVKTGKVKTTRRVISMKGVILSLVSGVFLGSFGIFLERSQLGDAGLGPYGVAFVFTAGLLFSTVLFNLFFINLPVHGAPLEIFDYFKGSLRQHALGFLGGVVWSAGTVGFLVAARAEGKAVVEPPELYSAAQIAPIISAICGVLIWREFPGADGRVRALLVVMFALFLCGLAMTTVAPAWTRA